MNIRVSTPDGVIYNSESIDYAKLPSQEGLIEVRHGHEALISNLEAGEIVVARDNHEISLAISSGFIKILDGVNIEVMVETAERSSDIDLERAKAAKAKAEEFIKNRKDIDEVQYAKMLAKLQKELARIRVASRR